MGVQKVELEIFKSRIGKTRYYIKTANIITFSTDPELFSGLASTNYLDIPETTPVTWRKLRKIASEFYNVELPSCPHLLDWKKYSPYYNTYVVKITRDI